MMAAFFFGLEPTKARLPQVVGSPSSGAVATLSCPLSQCCTRRPRKLTDLHKDGNTMEWTADMAARALGVEIGGRFVQQIFRCDGKDSSQVAIVSRDLAQVYLDKLAAGDRIVSELELNFGGSCSQRIDISCHGSVVSLGESVDRSSENGFGADRQKQVAESRGNLRKCIVRSFCRGNEARVLPRATQR
jgi:hypothetical protein